MLPPEDKEKTIELVRSMEDYYSVAFAKFREDDLFYEGEIEPLVFIPEGYDITIPATARAVIDEAVDNIDPQEYKIRYSPRGQKKQDEKDADAVRRWAKAYIHYLRRQSSDVDFLRSFMGDIFRNGKSSMKIVRDETIWPSMSDDAEEKAREEGGEDAVSDLADRILEARKRHVPYYLRSIGPRNFYEDPTVWARKLWYVEHYEADHAEVQGLFEYYEWVPPDTWKVRSAYDVYELWTADYFDRDGVPHSGRHVILVNFEVIHDGENPYSDLPYCVKYGGMGRESYLGEPEFKSVGLFTPQVKSLMKAEIRRLAQIDAILSQVAFPIAMVPDIVQDVSRIDVTPGAVNLLPKEVVELSDKIFLNVPVPDSDYLQSLQLISSQIERGTTQVPLRGAPVPGVRSSAQLTQYIGQSQLRLQAAQSVTEDTLSWAMSSILRLIEEEELEVTVPVGEDGVDTVTIDHETIGGHWDIRIEFAPNEEQVKERKLALTDDAINKGGMSQYDALEWAGFDNPSDMVARRKADDVWNEPEIRRAVGKQWLKDIGIDADEMALQEQVDLGTNQVVLQQILQQLQQELMGQQPGGQVPPGQDPEAALAQQGRGPMPMEQGAQPQDPALAGGGQVQSGEFLGLGF